MKKIFSLFNVPIERRLQTAAVFYYIFIFLISPVPFIILTFYLLFTSFWWLTVAYFVWFIYDFNTPNLGGRPSLNSRNSYIWKYFVNYFPIKLIKTANLSTDKNYILGSHPHGVISIANFASFCTNATGFNELFPNIRPYVVTLPSMFYFPFRREIFLCHGAISSNLESIEYILNDKLNDNKIGRLVSIVLGGAEEALDSHPNNFNLKLNSRRGFVRLALRFGASLVPTYHFGETSLYYQVSNKPGSRLRTYQTAFKSVFGFSPPIFFGRGIFNYVFGILPYRSPITTIVGAPINVKKNENPTNDEINELHQKYCKALCDLFDAHKTKYGISETTKLNFY